MPPDKEKAPPGGSGAPSKFIAAVNSEGSNHTVDLPISQLLPRDVRPDEVPELRALWWRQAAEKQKFCKLKLHFCKPKLGLHVNQNYISVNQS